MCLGECKIENNVSQRLQLRDHCVSATAQSRCDTRGTKGLDQSESFFKRTNGSDCSKPLVSRVSHRDCAVAETYWSRFCTRRDTLVSILHKPRHIVLNVMCLDLETNLELDPAPAYTRSVHVHRTAEPSSPASSAPTANQVACVQFDVAAARRQQFAARRSPLHFFPRRWQSPYSSLFVVYPFSPERIHFLKK